MKRLTIVITLIITAFYSFAQWEWQNPYPQGNSIYGISFIDENNGWAVGYYGTIIHTTDGGINWQIQESGIENQLESVCFVDLLNGWSIGMSTILNTNDGGITWASQSWGGTRFPQPFNDVWFVDQQTGWLVGGGPLILHTTDGGETWNEQSCGSSSELKSVYFIDENNGWAVGKSGIIITTANGGITWGNQISNTNSILEDIFFINADNGWAIGEGGTVLITSDGGNNWELSTDEILSGTNLSAVSFINNNYGWIGGSVFNEVSENGIILKTSDGGYTWEEQIQSYIPISCLTFENGSGGCAAGDYGELLITTDGGNSWDIISSGIIGVDFDDVFFTDELNGWASGEDSYTPFNMPNPNIFRTNNGGVTWERQNVPNGESGGYYKIFFSDEQHGWSFGYSIDGGFEYLISTTDAGDNWEVQITEDSVSADMYFINNSVGWKVGGSGAIQKTEDGGWNWIVQESGISRFLHSIFFIDADNGWVVGDSIILHTENGGETWVEQSSGIFHWMDVYFIDPQHGWVAGSHLLVGGVGSFGKIMQTTDGGNNWVEIEENNFPGLSQLYFSNMQTGWVLGSSLDWLGFPGDNKILSTNDGGLTWDVQDTPTGSIEGGFCFTDANNGWAVGAHGTILHTNNGGIHGFENINIEDSKITIQVYPNPFTTSTTFEYELNQPETVSISFYNQFGKQVDEIEERQQKGINKFVWTPELAGGVYYFRLEAVEQVASGKVVLVR